MSETKPTIEKVSDELGIGQFRYHQSNSRNFIHKKEKPVGRCEDINNDIFDLVTQVQTEIFSNSLKISITSVGTTSRITEAMYNTPSIIFQSQRCMRQQSHILRWSKPR